MANHGPDAFKPLSFGAGAASMTKWFWLACAEYACGHQVAAPYAPFAIRWGLHAPLERLRRQARCSKCGHKGAVITMPSWAGESQGWATFPAAQALGPLAMAHLPLKIRGRLSYAAIRRFLGWASSPVRLAGV